MGKSKMGEEILVSEPYVLKKICVNVGCRLSLQYHRKKTETMIVQSGSGIIYHDKIQTFVKQCSHIHIPAGTIHRVEALQGENLVILEVSTPELDDIVRLEDDYGRVNKKEA